MQEKPSFLLLTFNSQSDLLQLKRAQVICQTEETQKRLERVIEKIKSDMDQGETDA